MGTSPRFFQAKGEYELSSTDLVVQFRRQLRERLQRMEPLLIEIYMQELTRRLIELTEEQILGLEIQGNLMANQFLNNGGGR